jgi:hypothetical protein
VPVLFGGYNLPPLVEIGLTDLPKFGGAGTPRDNRPGHTVKNRKLFKILGNFQSPITGHTIKNRKLLLPDIHFDLKFLCHICGINVLKFVLTIYIINK